MNRAITWLLSLMLTAATASAQIEARAEALLLGGVDAAMHHDYDRARSSFLEAARLDPADAAGLVLAAGILHQAAEDLSREFDRREFDSLLTQAEIRATSGAGAARTDQPLWRATARGMLSVIEANAHEWMSAIRDALVSASDAGSLLRRDTSLIDAGLPLGNYLYWRSRKTEAIRWLPFIADDRGEGIRLLERCAVEGRFHRWSAVSSLIWILHDAGELDRAERWARYGLARYPDHRTFLAGLAKVLESQGRHREAANAWSSIEVSVRRDAGKNSYAAFSAGVNRLRCLTSAGETERAREILREIGSPDAGQVPEWLAGRLAAKHNEFDRLKGVLEQPASTITGPHGER